MTEGCGYRHTCRAKGGLQPPPALVLGLWGFLAEGTARRRRGLGTGLGQGCPRSEAWRASLLQPGQNISTALSGSCSILKQLLNLYPVLSLGPGMWPQAAFERATGTQALPHRRHLPHLAVLLQVLHFVQPPLCPLPCLGIVPLPLPHQLPPAATGGDGLAVARDPSCIPCPQKDFASWKLHGLQLVGLCKYQERLKC